VASGCRSATCARRWARASSIRSSARCGRCRVCPPPPTRGRSTSTTMATSSVSSDVTVAAPPTPARLPLRTEFLREQAPVIAATLALGVVASYLQHGMLVGGDRPFPLAGVSVAPWHLAWLGFSTGFVMALVGQGTGILSLPYAMSVLRFDNPHVSPTNLLIT